MKSAGKSAGTQCAAALATGFILLQSSISASQAQGWRWHSDGYVERIPPRRGDPRLDPRWGQPPTWDSPGWNRGTSAQPLPQFDRRDSSNEVRDGGARPEIMSQAPPVETFHHDYPASTIVIDASDRRLYFVLPGRKAYAYQISVGRDGFGWTGSEVVSRIQAWPDWHPPAEMRERDPKLPVKMTGGVNNPLGAVALYLGTTLYRIHGTNDERSLGQAQSSGCFRMMNANALHLASLAEIGTKVVVVQQLPGARVARAPQPDAHQAAAQPRIAEPGRQVPPPDRTRRYANPDDRRYSWRDRPPFWDEPPPRQRYPALGYWR